MTTGREPQQVAKRALILGTIAFRASLEVTEHPRVVEISERLLPWLSEVECQDELDPIERELLETPLGELSDSQALDANWAGEAATLFCWMLKLAGPIDETSPTDQSRLPDLLFILHPEAAQIVRSASLRDRAEIEDTCRHFVLIRSILQESRMSLQAAEIIRRMNVQTLTEVGLVVTDDALARASESVSLMTPEERSRAAGFYFVRAHAALWFFSDRPSYFAE